MSDNKENLNVEETNENVNNVNNVAISDDVFTLIANIATSKVEGVYGMHVGALSNIFSRNNYSKGVKIEKTDDDIILDIYIDVKYGYNVTKVAIEVQESVKNEIEGMTDLQVKSVNIHVEDIITEKKKAESEAEVIEEKDIEIIEKED